MRSTPILIAAMVFLCLQLPAEARKRDADLVVEPGASTMSSAEKSIVSNPDEGLEHAVLILEQEVWDQSDIGFSRVSYHLRAKILSNEGRALADVSIPAGDDVDLLEWWGRVIHPDGTVHEFHEDDLEEQSAVEFRGINVGSLKAALPAVEPGVVIDYGFNVRIGRLLNAPSFVLQGSYPLIRGEYRWRPMRGFPAAYWVRNDEKESIKIRSDRKAVVFEVDDLAAAQDEPFSPPDSAIKATVRLYYKTNSEFDSARFWRSEARDMERITERFIRHSKALKEAASKVPIAPGADFRARMEAAYNWVLENVENTGRRSAEEMETAADADEDDVQNTAKHVIKAGRGAGRQIDRLFLGLARALGAEARPLYVVDRTDAFFDPNFLTSWQFDGLLVAVRPPGAGDDETIVCDPSTGMPFGRVPWWFTGVQGFLIESKGEHRMFAIPPAHPRHNVGSNVAEIRFIDDNEAYEVHWKREVVGQPARSLRTVLRALPPDEREKELVRQCGQSPDMEILEQQVEGLDDALAPLGLSCVGEVFTDGIGSNVGAYAFAIRGPWSDTLPEMLADSRQSAVIYDYLRSSETVLIVHPPAGFAASELPSNITFDRGLAAYQLRFSREGDAIRVERAFELRSLMVMPEQYELLKSTMAQMDRADASSVSFRRKTP